MKKIWFWTTSAEERFFSPADALTHDTSDDRIQFLELDLGDDAVTVEVMSDIDDTTRTMEIVEPGAIDGIQEPIAFVAEDIDAGDTNAFFVRPMVGDLVVCQANVTKQINVLTPETCQIAERQPIDEDSPAGWELGWFRVTGIAAGECRYEVSYPDANGGQGVSQEFSYTIEP